MRTFHNQTNATDHLRIKTLPVERYEFSCHLNWEADCWLPFSPWTGIPHYFSAICYCRQQRKILSVTCTITFSFGRPFEEFFYWRQTKSLTTRGTKPYVAQIVQRRTVTVSDLPIMLSFFFTHTHTHAHTDTNPTDIYTIPTAESKKPVPNKPCSFCGC